MKKKLTLILILTSFITYAQKSITFKVEELKRPDKPLLLISSKDLYKNLILSEAMLNQRDISDNKIDFPYNIVAQSNAPDSLVYFGNHSFFAGMYQAYADHRPFVLSPDMISLLINQGFARHVNNNAEQLRDLFVNHNGKVSLIVNNNQIHLDNPNSPWEKAFSGFTEQIATFTGKELIKATTSDFTTTTPASKIASQITTMDAVKPYFQFIVITISCGIPEITLEGTTKDWKKVLEKARYLRKYKLDWWIDEIEPLLQGFIKASKGNIDKDFWRNMFKYHTSEKYGAPKIIDGWIVKFFPYDKDGKKNNLKDLQRESTLPNEIVKVNLIYSETINGNVKNTPLELWAGFAGVTENKKTFTLKPQIGWMVRIKDTTDVALEEKFKLDAENPWEGINIRVKTFPKEILILKEIKKLSVTFLGDIEIPNEIAKVKINIFKLEGKISEEEIDRIRQLLPNTILIINDKRYDKKTP